MSIELMTYWQAENPSSGSEKASTCRIGRAPDAGWQQRVSPQRDRERRAQQNREPQPSATRRIPASAGTTRGHHQRHQSDEQHELANGAGSGAGAHASERFQPTII